MVFIFIFATAGLLIWAAAKPWVGKWVEVSWDTQRRQQILIYSHAERKRAKKLYTGVESRRFVKGRSVLKKLYGNGLGSDISQRRRWVSAYWI